jgi:23S rRNA A2030 N6-methylase RlmJ
MANPHFANLGDVWKHLLLTEVISWLQPGHYVETHAGSAIYAVADDLERGLGAEMFLSASSEIEPLRSSPYRRHILELARGAAPSYPGSPLLAMMLLGRACRYVFCDTDPSSVADLRAVRERLGLQDQVRVIHGDGLAETTALLQAHGIGAASLVHVDPFDFRAAGPTAVSALQLVTCLAAASIPTFAWYGLTARSAQHELFHEVITAAPTARAVRRTACRRPASQRGGHRLGLPRPFHSRRPGSGRVDAPSRRRLRSRIQRAQCRRRCPRPRHGQLRPDRIRHQLRTPCQPRRSHLGRLAAPACSYTGQENDRPCIKTDLPTWGQNS